MDYVCFLFFSLFFEFQLFLTNNSQGFVNCVVENLSAVQRTFLFVYLIPDLNSVLKLFPFFFFFFLCENIFFQNYYYNYFFLSFFLFILLFLFFFFQYSSPIANELMIEAILAHFTQRQNISPYSPLSCKFVFPFFFFSLLLFFFPSLFFLFLIDD